MEPIKTPRQITDEGINAILARHSVSREDFFTFRHRSLRRHGEARKEVIRFLKHKRGYTTVAIGEYMARHYSTIVHVLRGKK